MKNIVTREDFYEYFDRGYKVIPIGESAKGQGKKPLLNDWLTLPWDEMLVDYSFIDNWFETFGDKITGIGLLLGPMNPGLVAMDVDTNDREVCNRLLLEFNVKVAKIGSKGFTAFFQADGTVTQSMYNFKLKSGLGGVEVFYSNKQTVMPPSWHSGGKHYRWYDDSFTLLSINLEDLPILSYAKMMNIGKLINGASTEAVNVDLPPEEQFNGKLNRTDFFWNYLGNYYRNNPHPDTNVLVSELLELDAIHFPHASYFKGDLNNREYSHNTTTDRGHNCLAYVLSMNKTMVNKGIGGVSFDEKIATKTVEFNVLTRIDEAKITAKEDGLPFFDKNIIPPLWRKMIDELHEGRGVPHHVQFAAFLCSLGSVMQGNIKIVPLKDEPTFFRRSNLAVGIVAESGSQKTDIVKSALYPIYSIDKILRTANSPEDIQNYENTQIKIKAATKRKNAKIEKGEDVHYDNIEIINLQNELETKKLKGTKFLYENATVQKMILDASKNQAHGLFLIKDEFKQMMTDLKKKGNEDARSFLMKGIDGNGDFRYNTISRGDDYIEHLFLSLLTCVQNSVLSYHINQLFQSYGENDGFLQRIQFIPYGEPLIKDYKPVNMAYFTKQFDIYHRLFGASPTTVHVKDDAVDYYIGLRKLLVAEGARYYGKPIASVLNKYQGLLCVYGLIFEAIITNDRPKHISKEALEYAYKFLLYCGEASKYLFNIKDKDQNQEYIKIMAGMLEERHFRAGATSSEMYQQCKHQFKNVNCFHSALKELEIRGYVSIEDSDRKNSKIIHINPRIYL